MTSLGRVLLVDDQPHISRLVRDTLQRFGYHVKAALTVGEALGLVGIYKPDVAILGLWIPRPAGTALVEEFRTRDPGLPIVVMSASRDLDAARAILATAFDFVTTPIDLDVLGQVVAAAMTERDRRTGSSRPR